MLEPVLPNTSHGGVRRAVRPSARVSSRSARSLPLGANLGANRSGSPWTSGDVWGHRMEIYGSGGRGFESLRMCDETPCCARRPLVGVAEEVRLGRELPGGFLVGSVRTDGRAHNWPGSSVIRVATGVCGVRGTRLRLVRRVLATELSVSGSRDNLETCEERVSLTCRTCDLGRRMPGLSRESTRVLQRPRRPAPSNVHVSNEGLSSAAEDDQRPKPRTSRAEIRTGLLRLSRRRVPGPRRLVA